MARNVQQDRIQLKVEVNGKQVENTIKDLKKAYRGLIRDRDKATIGSDEYKKLDEEAAKVKKTLDEQRLASIGLSKGIKAGTRATTLFGKAVQGVGVLIKSALAPLLAFTGISFLKDFGADLLKSAGEMEAFSQKAETVFGSAIDIVKEFAAQNATEMGLTRSEYINTATAAGDLLIPMGFQREEAAKLSSGLINLSGALAEWSGGQKDSKEVSEILTKALLGEREQLKTLGISIQEADVKQRLLSKGQQKLTGTSLQQAKALATLELITEKSADAQTAYANNTGNLVRQQARLSARWKDLKEQAIQGLIPVFTQTLGIVTKLTGGSQRYSDKLEKERINLNVLVNRITAYNETSEERKKLIDQLQQRYPKFLGSLNAESASNAQLRNRLREVNQEMINKIVIQRRDEEIQEQQQQAADTFNATLERRDKLLKSLQKAIDLGIIEAPKLEGADTLEDEIRQLQVFTKESLSTIRKTIAEEGKTFDSRIPIRKEISDDFLRLSAAISQTNKQTELANTLLEKRNEVAKQLGITIEDLAEEEVNIPITTGITVDEDGSGDKDIEKARIEALRKLEQLRIDVMEEGKEKRIAQIKLNAKEEIAALQGSEEIKKDATELINIRKIREIEQIETEYSEKRRQKFRSDNEKEKVETEKTQNAQLNQLNSYHEKRLVEITEQVIKEADAGEINPEDVEAEIQARMLEQLKAYLQKRKELMEQFGLDTTEIDQQIADLSLDIFRKSAEDHIQIEDEKWRKISSIAETANQIIGGFFQIGANRARSAFEEETDALEKAKQKELKFVGDNEEKRAEIEEKFDKKREVLDIQYRKNEQSRAIRQSVIDTAVAAVKALSTPPAPNIPASLLAGVLGGIQTAAIVAEKFAVGGPTVKKSFTNPLKTFAPIGTFVNGGMAPKPFLAMAGEAGPEWIAPNWMLNHPEYGPQIQELETIRVERRFAEGGFSDLPPVPQPSDEAVEQAGESTFSMLIEKMDELILISRNPKLFGVITEKVAVEIGQVAGEVEVRRVETGFGG